MQTDDPRIGEVIEALTAYQSALLRYIFLLLGDEECAKDVLQETNLYIWQNIGHLDCPEHFKPWAKTLAAFQIKRFLKDRAAESRRIVFDSDTTDRIADTIAGEEPGGDLGEVPFDALKKCLDKLPPPKRRLIDRRYWKRETVKEIAVSRRVEPSAVAMTLMRIRKELGDCIRHFLCRFGEEPPAPDEAEHALLMETAFEGDAASRRALDSLLKTDASVRHEWTETGGVHIALSENAGLFHLAWKGERNLCRRRRLQIVARIAAGLLLVGGTGWGVTFFAKSGQKAPPAAKGTAARQETVTERESTGREPAIEAEAPAPRQKISDNSFSTAAAGAEITPQPAAAQKSEGDTAMNMHAALAAVSIATCAVTKTVTAAGTAPSVLPAFYIGAARYWQTAFTNAIPVRWDWGPTNAAKAVFVFEGMNASGSNTLLRADGDVFCLLPASKEEDLYTLRLTYLNDGGTPLATFTGRVASVHGAEKSASLALPAVDWSSPSTVLPKPQAWPRSLRPGAKSENVVFACEAAWAATNTADAFSLTFAKQNGARTNTLAFAGATGWAGWKPMKDGWGTGWFSFTLAANGGRIDASVYRPTKGFVLYLK